MPAYLFRKNGITLTELLVSSILIGIVMIGVASFGVAISNVQNSTSRATILTMRTNAVMARITKDANLAVGDNANCGQSDATVDCGWGVRTWSNGAHLSICFRQNDLGTFTYTDDTWKCYYRNSGQNNLMLCGDRVGPAASIPVKTPGGGAYGCATGGDQLLLALDPDANIFYQITQGPNNSLDNINITLTSRFDPTLPVHPISNPDYTVSTRVSPDGQSK